MAKTSQNLSTQKFQVLIFGNTENQFSLLEQSSRLSKQNQE